MKAFTNPYKDQGASIDHIKFISHALFREQLLASTGYPNRKKSTYSNSPQFNSLRKRTKSFGLQSTLSHHKTGPSRKHTLTNSREISGNYTFSGARQHTVSNLERECIWDDFLKRQEEWNRQKKNKIRQKELQNMARQNPETRIHLKTTTESNKYLNKGSFQRQIIQIENTINLIRKDTEQLRSKVIKINQQKTFKNRGSFSKKT